MCTAYNLKPDTRIAVSIGRFVIDTFNHNMKQLTEIIYFDPYMRLRLDMLQKIFDKERENEDLSEDLLLDFSYDYHDAAEIFQEILLERYRG